MYDLLILVGNSQNRRNQGHG